MLIKHLKRRNKNENFTHWIWHNESTRCQISRRKGHEIVGTIEPEEHQHSPYKAYHHIADAQNEADVAIDFSNPNLLLPLLDEEFELPLVIATTGEKKN